jgi:hypothetical protein
VRLHLPCGAGASGLDGRERKAWEVQHLVSLGFSAPKRPRIPRNIGVGMAKKAAEREETARLETAAVNGGRLAKRKAKPSGGSGGAGGANGAARERGVAWGGGTDTFRGGMLHLKEAPRDAPQERRGGFSPSFEGIFKGGGGSGKRGKGGKGGGKRKGGGGGGGGRKGGGGKGGGGGGKSSGKGGKRH